MASVRKRNGKWQAQIRRKGQAPITKSFYSKADATAWARKKEYQADRQELQPNTKILHHTKLKDLLIRYRDEVSPSKRGGSIETVIINALLRHSITRKTLSTLTLSDFVQYRNERLRTIKPQTLKRQLTIISSVFKTANEEWEIPVPNPVKDIKLKFTDQRRDRRLQTKELEKLLKATTSCHNILIKPIILIAIETGMRRGEILTMLWSNVDLDKSTLFIPTSKNGYSRIIPLTPSAKEVLELLDHSDSLVFPITANAFRKAWERVKVRAGISDLRFHDLRHEAISRFFEMGLNIAEVASISGHKDFKMLFRYTHPKAEDIVNKFYSK